MINIKRTTIIDLFAALFIFLFAYTAIHKLLHFKQFSFFLNKFDLFDHMHQFIAWSVIIIELFISALLFLPASRKAGLLASFVLMSLFTAFIIYMMLTSKKLPCSCGGIINKLSWQQHLILNIFLIGLAGVGYYLARKHPPTGKQLST